MDRLAPPEVFVPTPNLVARLARFVAVRNPGGYLTGDRTRGGCPAESDERRGLAGFQSNGVPRGLVKCRDCREWRGECLDPSPNFAGR
jgi:hypothetical protein